MKSINPLEFYRAALRDPQLWSQLVGAELRHPAHGDGHVKSVELELNRRLYINVIFEDHKVETTFNSSIFENKLIESLYIRDELYLVLEEQNKQQPPRPTSGASKTRSPSYNRIILDWLFTDFRTQDFEEFMAGAIVTGSGPFKESEFIQFLESKGIPTHPYGDLGLVIVGWHNWKRETIDRQLDIGISKGIKIYSQEMVAAYFITGRDPYGDINVLQGFKEEHPALVYLTECGFRWPETSIIESDWGNDFDPDKLIEEGLLAYMGYHTGRKGASRSERRKILHLVYDRVLPRGLPQYYLDEWGMGKSKQRLLKLANTIASLARNAKRKANPPYYAIQDWEEDLEWLKSEYYKGVYRFQWPSTYIY